MHRKRDKWQTHPQTLFAWKDASKTINNKVINIKAKKVTVVLSTVDSSVKPDVRGTNTAVAYRTDRQMLQSLAVNS